MSGFTVAADKKSITCHTCGKTSYNENDVLQLYCGHCHRYHEGVPLSDLMERIMPGSSTFQAAVMCPKCGNHFPKGLTDMEGKSTALQPNSFTICGDCLAILRFDDNLQAQELGPQDLAQLATDERAALRHLQTLAFAARYLTGPQEPKGPMQ